MPKTLIKHQLYDARHLVEAGAAGGMWRLIFFMIDIKKIGQMTTTWAQFAPEKSFCNLTLAQAISAFQPVFDVRQELMEADLRYTALIARRDTVDLEANDLFQPNLRS